MILDDINDLVPGSHKLISVVCDVRESKCKKIIKNEYRNVLKYRINNNGLDICLNCSRTLKNSGRNNPNCKYKTLDDNFFNIIDSVDKAWVLGWIASDGHVSASGSTKISIIKSDYLCLNTIRDIVCKELNIKPCNNESQVSLTFNSKQIVADICRHLKINPGKKSDKVKFPYLEDDRLRWAFIRGYFEGDGCIREPRNTTRGKYPKCDLASNSLEMLEAIKSFTDSHGLKSSLTIGGGGKSNQLQWSGVNCLDFLGNIYKNHNGNYLHRKHDLYITWSTWTPSLTGGGTVGYAAYFKYTKSRLDAVPPSKTRVSDSGYDLTILEKVKQFGNVELYDTGIKVQPLFGYYFELVARSSIIKTGYILGNSVGIIDRSYVGSILVPLIKIDKDAPDLTLPCKLVQIIPKTIIHTDFVEVDSLEETSRGDKGFGSSGIS